MSRALETEYRGYLQALQKSDAEELLRHGVPLDPVIFSMIGVARIRMNGDLWEPVADNERGARVYVTPVRHDRQTANPLDIAAREPAIANIRGEIVDICAWHQLRPGKWALREGTELVLGNVEYSVGRAAARADRVYRDPRSWLAAGGDGVVILAKDPLDRNRVLRELEVRSLNLTVTERPRLVARLRA